MSITCTAALAPFVQLRHRDGEVVTVLRPKLVRNWAGWVVRRADGSNQFYPSRHLHRYYTLT